MDDKKLLQEIKKIVQEEVSSSTSELRGEIKESEQRVKVELRGEIKESEQRIKSELREENRISDKRIITEIGDFIAENVIAQLDDKADKSDIERLEHKLVDKVNNHEKRIQQLESKSASTV